MLEYSLTVTKWQSKPMVATLGKSKLSLVVPGCKLSVSCVHLTGVHLTFMSNGVLTPVLVTNTVILMIPHCV